MMLESSMCHNLTQASEDYLKTIFELTTAQEWANTNEIAERLGITAASVSGMLKKLAANDPPLLIYRKHHGVQLSTQGRQAALEVIRHHRLLELFLQKALGYSWDEVHTEADRLEHVISEDFEERMAQVLGDPLLDPHGEPIPTRELNMPPYATLRLSSLRKGQHAVIQRVEDNDPQLLRYLQSIGLVPQTCLRVVDYSAFDDNLGLEYGSRTVVLGSRVTNQIFVEVL
jgi:DtxR family Mn-dependent transcriptional regulator